MPLPAWRVSRAAFSCSARCPPQKAAVAVPGGPCLASGKSGSTGHDKSAKIQRYNGEKPVMTTQPTPKGAWKITFLLFLFMLVNFADKIVVGLGGAPIMDELKLQPEQFGLLGSSFFFLFSISAIVVGFIVNRVATRWVLLAMAVLRSLAPV